MLVVKCALVIELVKKSLSVNSMSAILAFVIEFAEKLLDTGKCIVAGRTRIWLGGIGNFITYEEAKDAVDCTLYTFDLESFLDSMFYEEIQDDYVEALKIKKTEVQQEYEEIFGL